VKNLKAMKHGSRKITYWLSGMLALATVGTSHAQQAYKISQFSQHNFLYNAGAAGAADQSSVGVAYRSQWSGMDGGPKTAIGFGDMYFEQPNIGSAIILYNDKTGPTSRTGGQLNISYALDFTPEKRLQFGLGVDVLQYKIDLGKLGSYIPNDPLLASSGSVTKADAAFGVYYRSPTFSGGISVQNLLQTKLGLIKTSTTNTDGRLYRHYYAMANYRIVVDEKSVLTPNAMIRYLPNAPTECEVGVRYDYDDMINFGFNWVYRQLFSMQVGVKIAHQFSIGYAYELYNTPVSQFSEGGNAHELFLRYFFKKKK
jgi:type IX secretion system PorP/SprF family membrane protein